MKCKPNETTVDLFWMLLRQVEEKCGNNAGPLDAELIRGAYAHFSKITGKECKPMYVKNTKSLLES